MTQTTKKENTMRTLKFIILLNLLSVASALINSDPVGLHISNLIIITFMLWIESATTKNISK